MWEKEGVDSPSKRFLLAVELGIGAAMSRLVRRNVRLQDNDRAYILAQDAVELSRKAASSVANIRAFTKIAQ